MSKALERKYERKNVRNVAYSEQRVRLAYKNVSKKLAREIRKYNIRNPKTFTWSRNRTFGYKINAIIGELNEDLVGNVDQFMQKGWILANKKNDILASQYLKNVKKATGKFPTYFNSNIGAMNEFIDRSINGFTISENIWKYGKESMDILQTYVGTGITSGRSAADISRDIRGILNEPNKYLDKPGKGRYRSPYKNALRLTRTETNMAYRMADHTRYKQMDFVIGIRVHLSSQHPKTDICDHLAGPYPKGFQFLGWHPSCFCYQTSILASQKDFLASLSGTPIPMKKRVTGLTKRSTSYIKKNIDTFKNYKTQPYWLSQNKYYINKALK